MFHLPVYKRPLIIGKGVHFNSVLKFSMHL